jgi:hypothetical protein
MKYQWLMLASAMALAGTLTGCGNKQAEEAAAAAAAAAAAKEAKIADALSAGLPSMAANSSVMDWDGTMLKTGTGPYTCMPTPPMLKGTAPMCMDGPWMAWAHAWQNREIPATTTIGVSYMLAGDEGSSNIDPYAEGPTDDNQWVVEGPHMMVLVPDPALLEGIPTDPANGGPYVMWKDTPYAHLMIPIKIPPKAAAGDPIADALSAASVAMAADSKVVDWEMKTLKEGTGRYTCMPTPPMLKGTAPMCMDEQWMAWAHAWMTKGEVATKTLGISYMLAGDEGASNIDPYAEGPTDDNQWVVEGPHLMLIVPDPALLEGIPTDFNSGGPYVMWKGTPYEHVMVPVADRP